MTGQPFCFSLSGVVLYVVGLNPLKIILTFHSLFSFYQSYTYIKDNYSTFLPRTNITTRKPSTTADTCESIPCPVRPQLMTHKCISKFQWGTNVNHICKYLSVCKICTFGFYITFVVLTRCLSKQWYGLEKIADTWCLSEGSYLPVVFLQQMSLLGIYCSYDIHF